MSLKLNDGRIVAGIWVLAEEAYERGEPFDATEQVCYGKGSRPFAINGYLSEVKDGKVRLWSYGPKHHDPPSGNCRVLLKEKEVA